MKNLNETIRRVKDYEPLWDGWTYTGTIIGSGGSGCVLELERGEERSVVKVIYIDDNIEKYNAVKNEIETMATLRGSYLVECLDYREEEVFNRKGEKIGYDFLIHMNKYEPFAEYLREEDFDANALCVQLTLEIGIALCVLHSHGILHRDVKPENIFIDRSGEKPHFRLGDFGVSKRISDMSGLTATGTLNFMAPESFKYYEYSYRSDIYNLGMTLYYILNDLSFPKYFEENSQSDIDNNTELRLSGEKLPAPKYGSALLKKVVLKCCEYKQKDRYGDVSELLSELFGQAIDHVGIKRREEKTTSMRVNRKRKRFLLPAALLGTLVIATVLLSAYFMLRLNQPKESALGSDMKTTLAKESIAPKSTVKETVSATVINPTDSSPEKNIDDYVEIKKIKNNNSNTNEYAEYPVFKIDSADAEKANKEISTKVNGGDWYNMHTKCNLNADILSVVFSEHFDGSRKEYDVFNFNVDTGKQLSNEELCQVVGLNTEGKEYSEFIKEIVENEWIKMYPPGYNRKDDNPYYNKIVSYDNAKKNTTENTNKSILYMDYDGSVCLKYTYYPLAGSETDENTAVLVPPKHEKNWKELYSEYLNSNNYTKNCRFILLYLNPDTTPELFALYCENETVASGEAIYTNRGFAFSCGFSGELQYNEKANTFRGIYDNPFKPSAYSYYGDYIAQVDGYDNWDSAKTVSYSETMSYDEIMQELNE